MSPVLYIKIEQANLVTHCSVKLGDIVKMECSEQRITNRLNSEKLLEINKDPGVKTVVSVLLVIQKIHEIYPELEVVNLGEPDFIVELKPKETAKLIEIIKVILVCLVVFFGSVFAMMTFNEDVSSLDSFRKVYTCLSYPDISTSTGEGSLVSRFFPK